MFKFKSKLIVAIMLVVGVATFIISCNKEESVETKTTMQVSDYSKVGEIHNALLTNVKDNFEAVEKVESLEERVEVINNFNKEFISKLDLSVKEKQSVIQGLDENKTLVVTSDLTKKCFSSDNYKSGGEGNLFTLIEQLKTDNQINENTHSILYRLSTDLKLNYESQLSDEALKQSVLGLISEFNNLGYDITSGEGKMVASILAISIASIEWWEENPDAFADNTKSTKALPVWAAADVVGGVLGAGMSAATQYGVNGDVNWEIVGYSALGGAATGSTGIVGKAAKWISGLF